MLCMKRILRDLCELLYIFVVSEVQMKKPPAEQGRYLLTHVLVRFQHDGFHDSLSVYGESGNKCLPQMVREVLVILNTRITQHLSIQCQILCEENSLHENLTLPKK